jgi:hypothetical protein
VAYSSATAPVGLLYIKSQTATGANVADWTTNGTHTTIISPGGACSYPSLQLVNLFPGVAFVDPTGALRFARSSSATGSAAWTASTIETGISAEFASLAMIGSYPAVAYHNQTSDRARFVISTDANGAGDASWANEQDVTTSGSAGRFTSLVMLATGRPAMAFRDDGNGVLKYAVMY